MTSVPLLRRAGVELLDSVLEASVIGSFSRIGIALRRRVGGWSEHPRLDGKLFVITGASSGIGRSAAIALAGLGADLILLGRDEDRLAATSRSVVLTGGGGTVETARVDLAVAGEIAFFASQRIQSGKPIDGLIHCAGALFGKYLTAPDGVELTLATHVLAPFRLTLFLSSLLRHPSSVIVTVSSGGMYTQRFDLTDLELGADNYKGAVAYARAKRAQVVLAHEWARRWGHNGVASYAMHPGWVMTPGLAMGLPSLARLGPLLRTPEQGADTAVWLATRGRFNAGYPHQTSREGVEGIWLDRQCRHEYYLPQTYRRAVNRARDGEALWQWCRSRTDSDAPNNDR